MRSSVPPRARRAAIPAVTRRSVLIGLGALGAGLLGPGRSRAAPEKVPVVATFSILADFVRQVGGDRVALATLVGPDGDTHVYAPSPADAKAVAEARLIVANGLGFDAWADRLAKASGTRAEIAIASRGVAPRQAAPAQDYGRAEPRGGSAPDPHAWQDVGNARLYVRNIRDALIAADPAGRETYEANAAAYLDRLAALDAEIRERLGAIPPGARRVISSHDAFGYFGAAYGVTFVAAQGVSTEAEATPKQVASLIRQIKRDGVKAVFVENISDARLIRRIAEETGAKLGDKLFSDALSPPGGPAATYIDMVRHNVSALAAGMTGS